MQDYIVGPYDQTIKTANLPVLSSIIGLAYGGDTPFQAEIYFINLARIIQVKFEVPFFDVYDPRFSDFGVPTAVRGTISFGISDYKEFLIPPELTPQQTSIIYASEADMLNMALFGMTAKQWRDTNPDKKGNIRDYAGINELICLSNMENINAVLIEDRLSQKERLIKLNKIAIHQMPILGEQTTFASYYQVLIVHTQAVRLLPMHLTHIESKEWFIIYLLLHYSQSVEDIRQMWLHQRCCGTYCILHI